MKNVERGNIKRWEDLQKHAVLIGHCAKLENLDRPQATNLIECATSVTVDSFGNPYRTQKKNAQINWPRVVSELLRPQPQPRKEIECALRVQQIPINLLPHSLGQHALVGQLVRQVNTPQPRRRKRAIGSAAIVIGGNSKFLQPLQAQIVCFVLLGKVLYLLRKVVPIALLENFKIKRLRGQQPAAFVQSVTNIQVQQPNVRRVQQARIKI